METAQADSHGMIQPQARSTPQLELSPNLRQVLKIVLLKVVS